MQTREAGDWKGKEMLFGYARVSTTHQNEARQVEALRKAGVEDKNIFVDKMSGAKESRPALDDMLSRLRQGDTVVIVSFDRLARSTRQLLDLVERFEGEGVELKSIKEQIDTSTPQGRLFFTVSSAFAEFERELIRERAAEGRALAKEKGVAVGRPKADEDKVEAALRLYEEGSLSVAMIAKTCGISRATIYNKVKERGCRRAR